MNATAVNNWLLNTDTVDKVLQHLMEHGHKVEGGDRLAKTIIFARNQDHAEFIEKRFNHHYPHYAGHFARVISYKAKYAQSLIDDFSRKDKVPHIAISVDMLDTGIDVPEVANLVFFKPVYSKIKFWQMIGRGTRLCPDLYGPGADKEDFRVFDFCFNFDFFRENPDGISGTDSAPLGARLFRARVQLLGHMQKDQALDPEGALKGAITQGLYTEVSAMNRDNFIVRMHLEAVERFQKRPVWDQLSDSDRELLQKELATLPSELDTDDVESRMFDLTALRMQLALAAVLPERPGRQDIYYLLIGGDGGDSVFVRDVAVARKALHQRFDAEGRGVVLLNDRDYSDYPLATRNNLQQALVHLAGQMNPDEDLLVVQLASHGGKDGTLAIRQPGILLPELQPADYRALLEQVHIPHQVLIVTACYSGHWLDALATDTNMILASARRDRTSFGCGDASEMTWFTKAVYLEAELALDNPKALFRKVGKRILAWEKDEGMEKDKRSEPQFHLGQRFIGVSAQASP